MASGEVVIQSMWSPAVTAVRSRGIRAVTSRCKEGYRGWGYALAPMEHLSGLKLDCAYEYMNWYTSGFQGAFIAAQGYYSAVPENAKKFLTEAEWDYWYGGKPAATDIKDPYGKLMEKAGNDARRRRVLGPHGQHRRVELGDGRGPLSDAALERVHHVLTIVSAYASAPLPLRRPLHAGRRWRLPPWTASWLQVGPLAFVLSCCSRCRLLFVVVSFFDYDRTGIYPAFILDNYRDLLTTPATLRRLCQLAEVRAHRLGDHPVPRLQHRLFPDLPRAQRGGAHGACSCSARCRS